MIYRFSITTPKDTASNDRKKTELKLCHGVIHQIDFIFPPGPQGLLHVSVNKAIHQIWPSNADETFAADFTTISFREHIPLLYEPFELEAYTYNLDDTFEHSCILRIGILPVHVIAPWLTSYDDRIKAATGI